MDRRFCIFDTEYTTWQGAQAQSWNGKGQHREITQIAAAIVTPGMPWEGFATFNVLVKPVLNPVLDAYATELTGITQERLMRDGLTTHEALTRFAAFAGDVPCFSNGKDIHVIAETCGMQKVIMPLEPRQFGSLNLPMYAALAERFTFEKKDYPSGRVHELVGVPLADGLGQVHDALRDVWSLFVTIEWLERDGARIWETLV